MSLPTGLKGYLPPMMLSEYPFTELQTVTNRIQESFSNLLIIPLSIRHSRLTVAHHTSMRQEISRQLYTNRCWSSSDYLMWNEFIFPKGILQVVSKTKNNTLGQESPAVLESSEILSLRIPLVLLTLLDD